MSVSKIDLDKKDWFEKLWPKLRKDNINNQSLDINICKPCIYDESCGKQSRRLGEIIKRGNKIQDLSDGPMYLEISMDYSCNQACMICGAHSSSLWRKYEDSPVHGNSPIASEQDIENLLKNMNIDQLDTLKILGGEPLLTDTHFKFLSKLEDKGIELSKIELWYNTNGSCRVDKNVIELWKKFKLVFLYFSIDDMETGFEYQRYPGNWKQVTDNMTWFRDSVSPNVLLRMERTINLLNAHRLLELNQWQETNYRTTKFNYPVYFNNHMAEGTLLKIENISEKHLEFLINNKKNYAVLSKFYPMHQLIPNNNNNEKVLNFIKNQDKKRNLSINSYFPEFCSFYQ
jgi:organic radical activating enzyme